MKDEYNNLPLDFQHPGGFVEEYMNFLNEHAVCPQPMFSLAASLALAGTLYGQHVQTHDGQRTNIFCITCGQTSSGKGYPLTMISRTLDECGATNLRLGQVTSDSAIEWALKQQSRFCLILDECGHYFANMSDPSTKGSPAHAIKPALLELWSIAGGSWKGKMRVPRDGKEAQPPLVIKNPHLCIYATTQLSTIFASLNKTDLTDGWLPRNLFFISETRPKPESKPIAALPNAIRYEVLKWKNPAVEVQTIPTSPEAAEIFARFTDEIYQKMIIADKSQDDATYLYGKARENAGRIALILAVSRAGLDAVIEARDAEYATGLVDYLISNLIDVVRENMCDNLVQRAKKQILKFVARTGEGGILKADLTRKTQDLRKTQRDEFLEELLESRQLICRETDKGMRFYVPELMRGDFK